METSQREASISSLEEEIIRNKQNYQFPVIRKEKPQQHLAAATVTTATTESVGSFTPVSSYSKIESAVQPRRLFLRNSSDDLGDDGEDETDSPINESSSAVLGPQEQLNKELEQQHHHQQQLEEIASNNSNQRIIQQQIEVLRNRIDQIIQPVVKEGKGEGDLIKIQRQLQLITKLVDLGQQHDTSSSSRERIKDETTSTLTNLTPSREAQLEQELLRSKEETKILRQHLMETQQHVQEYETMDLDVASLSSMEQNSDIDTKKKSILQVALLQKQRAKLQQRIRVLLNENGQLRLEHNTNQHKISQQKRQIGKLEEMFTKIDLERSKEKGLAEKQINALKDRSSSLLVELEEAQTALQNETHLRMMVRNDFTRQVAALEVEKNKLTGMIHFTPSIKEGTVTSLGDSQSINTIATPPHPPPVPSSCQDVATAPSTLDAMSNDRIKLLKSNKRSSEAKKDALIARLNNFVDSAKRDTSNTESQVEAIVSSLNDSKTSKMDDESHQSNTGGEQDKDWTRRDQLDAILETMDRELMAVGDDTNGFARYKIIQEDLKQRVLELKQQNLRIENHAKEVQSHASFLETKLTESCKKLEIAVDRETVLTNDLQASAQKVKSAIAQNRSMVSKIDDLELARVDLEAVKTQFEDQVLSAEADLSRQQELISKLSTELSYSSARELELGKELESTQKELVMGERKLQDQQGHSIVLEQDLERLRRDFEKLRLENIKLSDYNASQALALDNAKNSQRELLEKLSAYESDMEQQLQIANDQVKEVSELIKLVKDSVSPPNTMLMNKPTGVSPEKSSIKRSSGEELFLQNHRAILQKSGEFRSVQKSPSAVGENDPHAQHPSGDKVFMQIHQAMLQKHLHNSGLQTNDSIIEDHLKHLSRDSQIKSQRRQFHDLKRAIRQMKSLLSQLEKKNKQFTEENKALGNLLANSEQIQENQKKELTRLAEQNKNILAENSSLKEDNVASMRVKAELESKVTDISKMLEAATGRHLQLENELQARTSEQRFLEMEFCHLQDQVEKLNQEKEELEIGNEDMEKEQERLELLLLSSEEEAETVKKLEKQYRALKASSATEIDRLSSKIKELASFKNALVLEIQHVEKRNTGQEMPFHLSIDQSPEILLSDLKSILQKSCECITQLHAEVLSKQGKVDTLVAETKYLTETLAAVEGVLHGKESQDVEAQNLILKFEEQIDHLRNKNSSLLNIITALETKIKISQQDHSNAEAEDLLDRMEPLNQKNESSVDGIGSLRDAEVTDKKVDGSRNDDLAPLIEETVGQEHQKQDDLEGKIEKLQVSTQDSVKESDVVPSEISVPFTIIQSSKDSAI